MEENEKTTPISDVNDEVSTADTDEAVKSQNEDTNSKIDEEDEKNDVGNPDGVKVETFKFDDSDVTDSKSMAKKTTAKKAPKKKFKLNIDRKKLGIIGIGAVIIVSVAALAISNRNKLVEISEKQIVDDQTYEANAKAQFYNVGNTMFYATKDGMKIYDVKTKSEIVDTFTMGSPLMLYDGNYAAIAEQKGKQVRVYNTEGSVYNIATDGDIISFAVNPAGYCAVCYTNSKDSTYTVDVYNTTGVQISHTKSTTDNGIPVSLDLSDDGKILAISYLNTTELSLKSNILFYYTSNKDAAAVDNSDGMFSSFIFDNEIVGEVHFLTNDDCVAVSDNQIVCYKYGTSYTQRWNYEFTNYLKAVEYPANTTVACAYGERMNNSSGTALEENTVQWYNSNGNVQFEMKMDKNVTDIYSKADTLIVAMNKYFEAYTAKGDLLWTYTSTREVSNMQFFKNSNKVMIVTPTKMTVSAIKKGSNASDNVLAVESESEKTSEEEVTTVAADTDVAEEQ